MKKTLASILFVFAVYTAFSQQPINGNKQYTGIAIFDTTVAFHDFTIQTSGTDTLYTITSGSNSTLSHGNGSLLLNTSKATIGNFGTTGYKVAATSGNIQLQQGSTDSITITFSNDTAHLIATVSAWDFSPALPGGSSGWSLTGNSGTIPGTNYVGTTDNNLIFKIYNVTAGMLDSTLLNTSYGQRALYSASGALNTALGYISLANNTSGTRNTAIGANSFATATTGSRNTGIGYASATQLTTGSGNVVIGNRTARFLTTGNRNVVIGDSAQVGTTTTNSIVIGANANGNLGDSTLVITNAIAHMHLLLNGGSNGDVLTTDGSGDATWQPTTNTAWGLSGNAGTNPATSLLGTSDTSRLAIGVDSKKLLFLDANKNLFTDTLLSATIKAYDYNGDCDGGYSIFTLEDKDECGGANLKHVTSTNTTIIRATTHAYLSCDDGINSSFLDLQETKTTCNTDSFEVIGKIKIVDGTEGNGKGLTSNANGLASWTPTSTTELDSATIYALTPSNGTQYYCTDCTGNGITGRIVAFIAAAWRRLLFED